MAKQPVFIASDLSARNDRAVDRAIMLGRQIGQDVGFVHVRKSGAKDAQDIEKLEELARNSFPDPAADIDIHLPSGSPPETVGKLAAESDASVIVCAVARFNGLNDYFTGTAVDQIIVKGKRPVLVVKQRPHEDYCRLLVPVDFSPHSGHALKVAAELFPEAEITLLHAYHVAYEGLQKDPHLREETKRLREEALEEFLADPELAALKGRLRIELVYGDIGSALLQSAEDLDPDLIVAGTHGSGGLRRLALGSIASSMLAWVSQDVLVVPPGDRG